MEDEPIRLQQWNMMRDFTFIDDIVSIIRLLDKPPTPDKNFKKITQIHYGVSHKILIWQF